MRKGKLIAALVTAGLLVISFSVFAAASDSETAKNIRGFFKIDTSGLNAGQKSDAANYSKKIADLQKEFIDKMVQNGTMTKEDGDAAKKRIDEAYKSSQDHNGIYGLAPGNGGFRDFDGGKAPDKVIFDTSKLTDQQKTDIEATVRKIDDLQRSFIDTAVNDELLTKSEGDSMKSKLDAAKKDGQGKFAGLGGRGWFGFGFFRKDASAMTDQQKKDINDYTQKLSALRKELIGKYVAAGVITQEQGDSMLKKMEKKPGAGFKKGPAKGLHQGSSQDSSL